LKTNEDGAGNEEACKAIRAILNPIEGKKKAECCIVIPAGHALDMLETHLKHLEKQDTRDFDVLIIGKKPKTEPKEINMLICDEKYPVGSSGGFGLGQVQAYLLGYEYVINADLDCFPVSTNLVSTLMSIAKKTNNVVEPLSMSNRSYDPKKINDRHTINHYGIVPRKIIEKYGFENFRFYRGGEELDFDLRINAESALLYEKSVIVEHENIEVNHIERMKFQGNKYLYYAKNEVVADIYATAYCLKRMMAAKAVGYFFRTLRCLFFDIVMSQNHPDLLKAACIDGTTMNVEKVYCKRSVKIGTREEKKGDASVFIGTERDKLEGIMFKPKYWLMENRKKAAMPYLIGMCIKIIRCEAAYLKPTESFLDEYKFFIQYVLMLKPVKYMDGKIYTEKMSIGMTFLNAVFWAIAYPILVVLAMAMVVKCVVENNKQIKPGNLAGNLREFHKFLVNFDNKCNKQ